MKDATATMGAVLPADAGGRDAVHVAVIAVTAGANLFPGQDIGLDKGQMTAHPADDIINPADLVGIVDPFLKESVRKGQRFWLFLYPRTITGLHHQWTHPAFEDTDAVYSHPAAKLSSELWLRNWIDVSTDCPGYGWFMDQAEEIADGRYHSGDYIHVNGQDAHGDIPPEVWEHVENVLGRKIQGKRPGYFSCSC